MGNLCLISGISCIICLFSGLAACIICPLGYFCVENSTQYLSSPCPSGHYCPIGTQAPYDYPCDKGYYNNQTGRGSVSDCLPCDPGTYCDSSGLSTPTGKCAPGWYCSRAAWASKPTEVQFKY